MRESDVYEFLVRDIFELLGKLEGLQNLKVERKVYLDGLPVFGQQQRTVKSCR